MTNGFATTTGCQDKLDNYDIPVEWWSRRFEYPWVARYIDKDDVVVDAGCGVTHFFKHWLSANCSHVWAVDTNTKIKNIWADTNVDLTVAPIAAMPINDSSVDKVVCISVLEHTNNIGNILKEFDRVLVPDGRAIITLDVPTIKLAKWRAVVAASPLCFVGGVDWKKPKDVLVEPEAVPPRKVRRMVFCSVLKKR
jgi:ubiquinone/menaquinone biosynthesis C-methylase UbiE